MNLKKTLPNQILLVGLTLAALIAFQNCSETSFNKKKVGEQGLTNSNNNDDSDWDDYDPYEDYYEDYEEEQTRTLLTAQEIVDMCPESISFHNVSWENCAEPIVSYFASVILGREATSSELNQYKVLFDENQAAALDRVKSSASTTPVIGYVDSVTNDLVVHGWALDPASPDRAVEVHVYIRYKDPSHEFVFLGTTIARRPRSDINQHYGVEGHHGFVFSIPPEYANGHNYELRIYGIDHNTNPILRTIGFNVPEGNTATLINEGRTLRFEFFEGLEFVLQNGFGNLDSDPEVKQLIDEVIDLLLNPQEAVSSTAGSAVINMSASTRTVKKKFTLGSKGCGGTGEGYGWCAAAIPRKCGSVSKDKANTICRRKGYQKSVANTTAIGKRARYCNPAGGGCHMNENTKCNRVFTSVTCVRQE